MHASSHADLRPEPRHHDSKTKFDHPIRAATIVAGLLALALMHGAPGVAAAQAGSQAPLASMAPVEQYRMPSRAEEIALARSAAPPSISGDAEVLVLGDRGYESAVKGKNGFVCLVERSWFAGFDDPVFWNPRIRGPDCLNPAAVSTVLPIDLERTKWALSGLSKDAMRARSKSSAVARRAPAPGAMGYMMSRQGHLSDTDGHWHPHLMFFQKHADDAAWGANLPESPVLAADGGPGESTILFVPLAKWSDGTDAMTKMP